MRVLVTGGTGLIGHHACRELLAAGHEVSVLDRHVAPGNIADIADALTVVEGDVADPLTVLGLLRSATHVLHLAAMILHDSSRDPVEAVRVNALGTAQLFEIAHVLGIEKVVYASTQSVFGPCDLYGPGPIAVDAPYKPIGVYGASKVMTEAIAVHYRRTNRVRSLGIRPCFTYGYGRRTGGTGAFNAFVEDAAVTGRAALPEAFPRDLSLQTIYVKDMARAFVAGLERGEGAHAVVNAPTRERWTVGEIVGCLERVLGVDGLVVASTPVGEGRESPPMETESAFLELGVEQRYPLERGLRDMVEDIARARARPAGGGPTP
jgi:nucleoside-diphosphate-sugar epimerase